MARDDTRILVDRTRHTALGGAAWDAPLARAAIAAIARETEAAFDPRRLWPLHPADDEPGTRDVVHGLYVGAAGTVHGLARPADAGLHEPRLDLAEVAAGLDPEVGDEEDAGASLLAGSTGILLVAQRLAPTTARREALAAAITSNLDHPANEFLYGTPGRCWRRARSATPHWRPRQRARCCRAATTTGCGPSTSASRPTG